MGLPVWLMLDLEETCEELIITQMINNFVNKLLSINKTVSGNMLSITSVREWLAYLM